MQPKTIEKLKAKGAVQMLESIIEIAEEEGEETVSIDDLKDLLETYRKRAE